MVAASLGLIAWERTRNCGLHGTLAPHSSSCFPVNLSWAPGRLNKQALAYPTTFACRPAGPGVGSSCSGLYPGGHALAGPPLLWGQNGVAQGPTCGHHLGTCDCRGQRHEVACRNPGPLPYFLPSRNPRPLMKPHGLERMLGRATAWLVLWLSAPLPPGPASSKHFARA